MGRWRIESCRRQYSQRSRLSTQQVRMCQVTKAYADTSNELLRIVISSWDETGRRRRQCVEACFSSRFPSQSATPSDVRCHERLQVSKRKPIMSMMKS